MPDTIIITGASSGIGKETATLFQSKGWNVVATMRSPDKEQELTQLDNVLVTRLDVTDDASIKSAIDEGIRKFGKVDALINNAGYGAFGPLEASSKSRIERQFDTNVIGLLETTKAMLPHFRENRSGIIVNISSVAGKIAMPLGTLYHGTKFAVEGLSEALQYELEPIGIKVKIVEPGMIATDFAGRSFDFANEESLQEYQPVVLKFIETLSGGGMQAHASPASLVADVIWEAVTDGTSTLRYTAGEDAQQYIAGRKALNDDELFAGIKQRFGL
jgi:short-subunit dehydrogenase